MIVIQNGKSPIAGVSKSPGMVAPTQEHGAPESTSGKRAAGQHPALTLRHIQPTQHHLLDSKHPGQCHTCKWLQTCCLKLRQGPPPSLSQPAYSTKPTTSQPHDKGYHATEALLVLGVVCFSALYRNLPPAATTRHQTHAETTLCQTSTTTAVIAPCHLKPQVIDWL